MNELRRDINLEGPDLDCLINDELEEELVDPLEMWPGGINLILLINTGIRHLKGSLLHVWKWPEYVLLYHGHHIVQVRYDQICHDLLILQELLDLVDSIETLRLALHVLRFILVVIILLADSQLLQEGLLCVLC